jgi:asparagine synthase (glutamine-hydrolysing)
MCGINLIIDKANQLDSGPIEKMNQALYHRGPDNNSFEKLNFHGQRIHLGHTRLKIIDLCDSANQPFTSENGKYHLLFNGMIYNFYQLKNQLIDEGISFETRSDTEVLFHWLLKKGKGGLSDLDGMFALVFIDLELGEIIAARDQFGMKPLYFFNDENYLIISSEIKGIFASGLVEKRLNKSQIPYYLNFRYCAAPQTFFLDILSIMPGECLTIRNNFTSNNFNKINKMQARVLEDTELIKSVETTLVETLGNYMIADVPVGLFLSGGIDSTLLLSMIKENYNQPIPTFSIVTKAASFGTKDGYYAEKAAKQYGTDHFAVPIGIELLDEFDDIIDNMDQPIGDSAYMLTHHLSKFTKDKVRVVLSGAGADEWFGGYNRLWAFRKYLKYYNLLKGQNQVLKTTSKFLPTGFNYPFRKKMQLAKKFIHAIDASPSATWQKMISFDLFPLVGHKHYWNDLSRDDDFQSYHLGKAIEHDKKNYLVNDILALNDQFTMSNNIEMRMPYLSKSLNDLCQSITPETMLKNGQKWILKELLKQYGGQTYVNRLKEGFGIPFGQWLNHRESMHLVDFLNNENCYIFEFIDREVLQSYFYQHRKGWADNSLLLWSVITLAHWLEKEFK